MRTINYRATFDISLYCETRIKCNIINRLNMVSAEASQKGDSWFPKRRFFRHHHEGQSSELLGRCRMWATASLHCNCKIYVLFALIWKSSPNPKAAQLSLTFELSHCCFCLFYALSHSSSLSLKYSRLHGTLGTLLPVSDYFQSPLQKTEAKNVITCKKPLPRISDHIYQNLKHTW